MQKVTVANVRTKSGEGGKGGSWTLVIVTGEDGAEFTSFDKGLAELGKGAVIELEPEVVTKNGKTKVNIKEWKLISAGAPPTTEQEQTGGPGGGGRGKDREVIELEEQGRRYRQNIDRISIERQSVYNGVIAIIPHYHEIKLQPDAATELNGLIVEALKWGRQALRANPQQTGNTQPPVGKGTTGQKPAQTATGGQLPDFKTGVDLVNYATKQGMKIEDIKRTLSINNPTEIKDIKAAAAVLFSKKPETGGTAN